VALITFFHLLIDATKTILILPDKLWSYLADQGLHIVSILAVAAVFPGAWRRGSGPRLLPPGTPQVHGPARRADLRTPRGHFAIAVYIAGPPLAGMGAHAR
jgi:hypothetical protein